MVSIFVKNNRIFLNKKPISSRFYLALKLLSLISFIVNGMVAGYVNSMEVEQNTHTEGLSLAEAIQRTFNNHPDLQSYQYQLEAQRGVEIQAGLSKKPVVELNIEDALGNGEFSGLDNAQTTLSVSWILDQQITQKRTAVASRGLDLIETELKIKQLDMAVQTAGYFLTALSYQESEMIAKRGISLAKETVSEVKKRVNIGKTPLAELYRAEAELAKRQLVLVDLKHEMASSIRQLAAQWGSTQPGFRSVTGSLAKQPQIIPFDVLKKRMANNPYLARYLSQSRVKQAELKLAQEERESRWKFSTGLRRYEQTGDFGVVAGVSIPFGGENNNQGRIAQVKAEVRQNQSEADALKVRIKTSLFIVYQQLEHSLHVGEMLEFEIIPRLEKSLKETHKAYELGKYSYLEWLEVQKELLDAQSALLDTNLSAHLHQLELERLTGSQITSPF